MSNKEVFDRFLKSAPFAVMTRCVMKCFFDERLDQVFEDNRGRQYEREAKFSAIALTVADVALNFSENFNQAYKSNKDELAIAITSFYDKVKRIEAPLTEAVVADAGAKAAELQDALGFTPWEILPGYRVLAIDGNHLAKTDKRLGILRDSASAPLPGTVVGRYDLQRQLFDRAYLLENAHDQESVTCDRILEDLEQGDVVLADRHFCIVRFLTGIAEKRVHYVIRQHGRLPGVLLGKRKRRGRTSTGMVYEQAMQLTADPDSPVVRRITVELDEPTQDGDTEIHILTNLPSEVDAKDIADAYRLRWEEETAFHRLQMTLTCELTSVGHPRAALFLFCMAMVAYDIRQVIFAALYAEHDEEEVDNLSHHAISLDISRNTPGMEIALDEEAWNELIPSSIARLATLLRQISRRTDLSDYQKAKRGPKKKKPKRSRNAKHAHVATAELLNLD